MEPLRYCWNAAGTDHVFDLVSVAGTHGQPYAFGERSGGRAVEVQDFHIGTTPVTQALWTHIMGADANPAEHRGMDLPVENVSWDQITRPNGFLDRINESPVHTTMLGKLTAPGAVFRLPSETEWEYAARGGPFWADGFRFSGSDDIDAVAWHDRKQGDHTQPVGSKSTPTVQREAVALRGNMSKTLTAFRGRGRDRQSLDVLLENLRNVAERIDPLLLQSAPGLHQDIVEAVEEALVGETDDTGKGSHDADAIAYRRFRAQESYLAANSPLRSIANDFDQTLAVPYFTIDRIVLTETAA